MKSRQERSSFRYSTLAERGRQGKDRPRPPQATCKPTTSHLLGRSEPPSSHLQATLMRPSCDPHATPMRPPCDPHVTPKPTDSQPIGNPKPHQSHTKATCLLPLSVYVLFDQAEKRVGINYCNGRIGVLSAQDLRPLRVPARRLQNGPGPQKTRPVRYGGRLLCHVGSRPL